MEKRLIDANAIEYTHFRGEWRVTENDIENIQTVNAIIIPQGATNGTIVMKTFNSYYAETDHEVVRIEIGGKIVEFDLDWWFAPYKLQEREK